VVILDDLAPGRRDNIAHVVDSGGVVFVEGGRVFNWLIRRTVSVGYFSRSRGETDPPGSFSGEVLNF
jgi:hypothetical protein